MYETGSATGVVDLITKLEVFLAANGWTTDSFATEGSGKRYHAHNGSVYLNMRAYVGEIPDTDILGASASSTTALGMNIGTGTALGDWFNGTGTPVTGASKYATAGMNGLTGTIPAYHFFAHNAGASITIVVEYVAGYYQYINFGSLNKFGTYTGGSYFTGSKNGVSSTAIVSNGEMPGVGFFSKDAQAANTSPGFVSLSVDAETGWHWSDSYSPGRDSASQYIVDNYTRFVSTLLIQPNTLNDLAVLMPVVVTVERDSNHDSSTHLSPIGELPNTYLLRITHITPGQQITLGVDDYRVFPFFHKYNSASTPSSIGGHSSYFGFAVKE